MKRTVLSICLLLYLFPVDLGAQYRHTHIRYLDENGNPVENHDDHEGHDHATDHEGHEGTKVVRSFVDIAPRLSLAMQKSLFAEIGASLDFYRIGYTEASEYVSFGYRNARPYISGEIMAGRHLLGGGKAGMEYIMSTPIFGMAVGGDVSYLTDGTHDAILLTPRLVLSFVKVEVFYGYNFFLRNELTRYIGHHRFGVSMTLNPRFWKRKKQIYNDYYLSYPQP